MNHSHRPLTLWILLAVLLIIGSSAFYESWSILTSEAASDLMASHSLLSDVPVPDFFIPEMSLLILLGIVSFLIMSALYTHSSVGWLEWINPNERIHWSWAATLALSLVIIIWVSIKPLWSTYVSAMEPIHGILALIMMLLALSRPVRKHLSFYDYK